MPVLKTFLSRLSISALFAVALFGVLLPPQILAQALPPTYEKAAGRLDIEILEVDAEAELPARFRVTILDRPIVFELEEGGYRWHSEDDASINGFEELPDLAKVLDWNIEKEQDGLYRVEAPLDHFQAVNLTERPEKPAGTQAKAEMPRIQGFGSFDPTSKNILLSATTGAGLMDISVDFSAIDQAVIATDGGLQAEKVVVVVVNVARIAAILGIAVVTCGVVSLLGGFICDDTCLHGVEGWSSQCVPTITLTCECADPPISPPSCQQVPVDGGGIYMSLTGGDGPSVEKSPYLLNRFEGSGMKHHGAEMGYTMAEWAVVSYQASAADYSFEVGKASSDAFAHDRRQRLRTGLQKSLEQKNLTTGAAAGLMVVPPPHDNNDRLIPLPDLRLETGGGDRHLGTGRAIVRLDYSEDRQLQALDVLVSTDGLHAEWTDALRAGLAMDYQSDKQHRVIAFATVDIDGNDLSIDQVFKYLPKCCGCTTQPPYSCQ